MKTKTSGIKRNLSDGTATIDYHVYGPNGSRIHIYQTGISSVAAAKILLPKLIDEAVAKCNPRKNGVLFDRLFDEWVAFKKANNYAVQTVDDYFYILRKYALAPFAGRFLDDCLSTQSFSDWWMNIIDKDDISISKKNEIGGLIRDLLDFARKKKYISAQLSLDDQDIAEKIKDIVKPRKVVLTWTAEQIGLFFKTIDPKSMDYLMFKLAFWLGCRPAELLAIQGKCHTNGIIIIQQQVIEHRGHPSELAIRLKTSASYRICPLSKELDEELKEYESLYEIGPEDYLFTVRTKKRWMSKTEYTRRLKRYELAAGLPHLSPKGIRHTRVRQLKEITKNTAERQAAAKYIGHSDPVDTVVYGTASDDDVRELIDNYIQENFSKKKA